MRAFYDETRRVERTLVGWSWKRVRLGYFVCSAVQAVAMTSLPTNPRLSAPLPPLCRPIPRSMRQSLILGDGTLGGRRRTQL
ncbi:hypothetical protein PsYK624_090000 [Phanerochaete sordida]|uniref:Uncharacterized protein n=1 Tax=Phanerochaete sordida TaxID=48140 RepID=A0A9P3GBR1_9APHY|nr:hypothetical protein PsYK624_090000 [Phanerochaete sordida]